MFENMGNWKRILSKKGRVDYSPELPTITSGSAELGGDIVPLSYPQLLSYSSSEGPSELPLVWSPIPTGNSIGFVSFFMSDRIYSVRYFGVPIVILSVFIGQWSLIIELILSYRRSYIWLGSLL